MRGLIEGLVTWCLSPAVSLMLARNLLYLSCCLQGLVTCCLSLARSQAEEAGSDYESSDEEKEEAPRSRASKV